MSSYKRDQKQRPSLIPENLVPIAIHPSPPRPTKTLKLKPSSARSSKPDQYFDERLSRVPIKYTNPRFKKSPERRRRKSRSRSPRKNARRSRSPDRSRKMPRRSRSRSRSRPRRRTRSPKKPTKSSKPRKARSPVLEDVEINPNRQVAVQSRVPLTMTCKNNPQPTCSTPPHPGDPSDQYFGSNSTKNRLKGCQMKLKLTEGARDAALKDAKSYRYKYCKMKERAESLSVVNSGLMSRNTYLENQMRLQQQQPQPYASMFPMPPQIVSRPAPMPTFGVQPLPRSQTVESVEVPDYIIM